MSQITSPLYIVSQKGNLECVKLLIEAKAEVNQAEEVSLMQYR